MPRAFWNDVVGRGRFSPGRLEYDGHREACLPLYRPSPTAPLFSMADGQSYRPSTNSNFTRYSTPTKVAGPSLGKAPAGDSTSPRIHLFEPLLPLRRLYLSFILCLVRRCASRVIFRPYSVCKRIRYEENKFEEIYWKYLVVVWLVKFSEKRLEREILGGEICARSFDRRIL